MMQMIVKFFPIKEPGMRIVELSMVVLSVVLFLSASSSEPETNNQFGYITKRKEFSKNKTNGNAYLDGLIRDADDNCKILD
jgi:hypothetical protein